MRMSWRAESSLARRPNRADGRRAQGPRLAIPTVQGGQLAGLGTRRFQHELERRGGDRVTIGGDLEGLVEQLIGILDLPGDETPQGGLARTVGFLGIGPGRAEECLGRVVVLELGQSLDRGDADLGLGVRWRLRARRRGTTRRRYPGASTISRRAGTAFSRFQAAERALTASGLSLAVLASARAAANRPSTQPACSSWKRFSSADFSKSSSLISQPSGSIWTIRGFAAAGITNSCSAASITIGTTRVLPTSSVISRVVGSLNRGV